MTTELEQLTANYNVPYSVPMPFFGVPEHRFYTLTPKYEDGNRKGNTEVELTEYANYSRGRFYLTWTTDWNPQQFLEWVNRFIASSDTSGHQTRFDRVVEHYAPDLILSNDTIREIAAGTTDLSSGPDYRLIVERAQNSVRAYITNDDTAYKQVGLVDDLKNGERLNSSQLEATLENAQSNTDVKKRLEEAKLWVGLDACSLSYQPRDYDVHNNRSIFGHRATITMGDFGADMLDEVVFAFVQTDVPEAERFYFLEVLKQAISHRATESAKMLHLEDLRYPRLRDYQNAKFDLYGWDPRRHFYKVMDSFKMEAEHNVFLLAEVIKTPDGPVIALDIDKMVLENQDFDLLGVYYTAGDPNLRYISWETANLSLDQIRRLLELEYKYGKSGRLKLFISNGAIKGDFANLLKVEGEIPETIGGWEDIVMRFSRTGTYLDIDKSDERELVIEQSTVPSMNITFGHKLESE